MALNRFEVGIVTRTKGQSAIARAAYNAREKLMDERTNRAKDYRYFGEPEFEGIFAPPDAPEWARDRQRLWNEVERREDKSTRPDQAQLARDFKIALPHELNAQQREWLVKDFAREMSRKGMVLDVAIHAPDADNDERNWHFHALCTMREIGPEGFGKKNREWNRTEELERWRARWSELGGRALERTGFELEADRFRVGHLTLEKQREAAIRRGDHMWADVLDREPTKHMGPHAAAMERRGVETRQGDINLEIDARNWAHAQAREFAPERLSEARKEIWAAYQASRDPDTFRTLLAESGMTLTRATEDDVRRTAEAQQDAFQRDRYAPVFRDGEYVVVTQKAHVCRLTPATTGEQFWEIKKFMKGLDGETLPCVAEAQRGMADREAEEITRRTDPELLRESRQSLWLAFERRTSPYGFQIDLEKHGLHLARVTVEDHQHSRTLNFVAERYGKYSPILNENEYVAVDRWGDAFRLNARNTGVAEHRVAEFTRPFDNDQHIPSLRSVRAKLEAERAAEIDPRPTGWLGDEMTGPGKRVLGRLNRGAERAAGKMLEFAVSAIESLVAPATPAQKLEAELVELERLEAVERAAREQRARDHEFYR